MFKHHLALPVLAAIFLSTAAVSSQGSRCYKSFGNSKANGPVDLQASVNRRTLRSGYAYAKGPRCEATVLT